MAAAGAVEFLLMNEAELREWVQANPGRVNDRDRRGYTPLHVAAWHLKTLSLTTWLLDEKGADVNGKRQYGETPLHRAASLDVLDALMDRGADPTLRSNVGWSPLMYHTFKGKTDRVKRLLQDPRVRASVDVQGYNDWTALHFACDSLSQESVAPLVHLLLEAGANPTVPNNKGQPPLALLQQHNLSYHTAIALLEQALGNAETTSLLVKVRRLIVAARRNIVAPSCLKGWVARGEPLPGVALVSVADSHTDGEDEEDGRKFRTMLTFLLGIGGGPEDDGMPRDVFRLVLDLLMPAWDPLRKRAGAGQPLQG